MTTDCLFCRIASGEIPTVFVHENDHCVAFSDINPQAPLHVLVIPRKHVASLDAAASEGALLGEILLAAADVARQERVDETGYRVVLNTNGDGGQTVFHLHAHVMGGRAMRWPPG